jgi:peptidoglycan/LPS O-acetylase OafA/YrhL
MSLLNIKTETSSEIASNPNSKKSATQHVFFPNLNGLRFIAAMMVIVNHVEAQLWLFHAPNFVTYPFLPMFGSMGVTLFFVLSGFLITYLLLTEKETFGQIKFGAFYLRRILRIWPLYYFVVILGFIMPNFEFFSPSETLHQIYENLPEKVALYAFIMPNVVKELYPMIPYSAQTWSIGVEEQFYIIWPILVHYSTRYFRNFLLLAGFVYAIGQLSWMLTTPQRHILPINELTTFIKNFLFFFRIQCMAIGGIFALVLFRNMTSVLSVLTTRVVQIGVWILLVVMILRGQYVPYINQEFYSVLFGIAILNLALTDTSIINLRHKVIDYLGRISYGLYMLHVIAVVFSIRVISMFIEVNDPIYHLATYILAVPCSVALASFSYYYFESPFLKLKKRFARVSSGG